jgi:N,N'-diacetyllegionaminate synthase
MMASPEANRTFIIAEAGVNHNGRLDLARQLVEAAASAGADAVKFQTFRADALVGERVPKAPYQQQSGDPAQSQYRMIQALELDLAAHRELFALCRQRDILFLSSPFDLESAEMLYDLGVGIIKIASGEITNLPLLRTIGRMGKGIILSTGMASLDEIHDAMEILVRAGAESRGIVLLHCVTAYPTPFRDANLRAISTLQAAFPDHCIGYSDHTLGIEASIAAVALGAGTIEKHLTLDRKMTGPDHKASLEPQEFRSMVEAIRNVEPALGDGIKRPAPSEMENMAVARKSIVAARAIRKGETFSEDNLTVKRPGTGMSPMAWDTVIGRKAERDYRKDECL